MKGSPLIPTNYLIFLSWQRLRELDETNTFVWVIPLAEQKNLELGVFAVGDFGHQKSCTAIISIFAPAAPIKGLARAQTNIINKTKFKGDANPNVSCLAELGQTYSCTYNSSLWRNELILTLDVFFSSSLIRITSRVCVAEFSMTSFIIIIILRVNHWPSITIY